jgi:O-antigen ligase
MSSQVATVIFVVGILGLFWLDRDDKSRPSKALWIPVAWLFINSSRPLSLWLSALGLWHAAPTSAADMYLEGSPIDGSVFTLLLFAGLFVLVVRLQRVAPFLWRNVPILVYFFYCLLSVFWSAFPWVTFKHWNKGIGDIVVALIVLTDPEPATALRKLFTRVGFVLIPLSFLFARYLGDLGRNYTISGVQMYTGVTMQKNSLGILCLIVGLFFLWSFLAFWRDRKTERRVQHLITHAVILAMVVHLLWMCNSMTSISCLAMAGGVMVLASRPMVFKRPWVVHFLVAATVCFSVFALFFDPGGDLLQEVGRNPTLTGRTAIWSAVIPMVRTPLVGAGYESFWLGDRLQQFWSMEDGAFKGLNEAHNGYIEIYLNLGWIGIVLLATLIVTGYRKIIHALHVDPLVGSLGLAFFVAEVMYNFTEAGFRMMGPLWILFLLAILGIPRVADAHTAYSMSAAHARHPADVEPRGEPVSNRRLHWNNI